MGFNSAFKGLKRDSLLSADLVMDLGFGILIY
jgi:hypothetical protein